MDRHLFIMLNSMAGQAPWLDALMLFFSRSSEILTPLSFALLWWWPGPQRPERRVGVILTILAMLIALGICTLVEFFVYRPRPFETMSATLLVKPVHDASFPSTHSAALAAVVTALPWPSRWLSVTGWIMMFGLMLGRVYVGAHFPGDMLGGLVTGWLSGATITTNRDCLQDFARRAVASINELL